MVNFNYSISLDEQGNVKKKVRLIKYNTKILAFSIVKPETQYFFNNTEEFLESVKDCEPEIFEDLTGENIFNKPCLENNFQKSANTLTLRVIPEKRSQIRIDWCSRVFSARTPGAEARDNNRLF